MFKRYVRLRLNWWFASQLKMFCERMKGLLYFNTCSILELHWYIGELECQAFEKTACQQVVSLAVRGYHSWSRYYLCFSTARHVFAMLLDTQFRQRISCSLSPLSHVYNSIVFGGAISIMLLCKNTEYNHTLFTHIDICIYIYMYIQIHVIHMYIYNYI